MNGSPSQCYQAYGTVLDSVVPLRGFETSDADPDVTIRFGKTPERIQDSANQGMFWNANAEELLLDLPDVGRYHVQGGRSITIEAASRTAKGDTLLVGVPIAAALMQRGFLVMHAAAVHDPELGAVAICGLNGAGKSSLSLALGASGDGALLCDNLGAIGIDRTSGGHVLHRGPQSFRLWQNMAEQFQLDPSTAERVTPEIAKFVFDTPSDRRAPDTSPLTALICLESHDGSEPILERTSDLEAVALLAGNHFRSKLARVTIPNWFDRVNALAASTAVFRLRRPDEGCPPPQLAEYVRTQLAARNAEAT